MTFVQAAVLVPFALCVLSILLLRLYVLRKTRQDRMNEVAGLDHLHELRWNGWTLVMGWPPVTCWQGCADLHRVDWWNRHLHRTCWQGCADLHRDDWWRAYLGQTEQSQEQTTG